MTITGKKILLIPAAGLGSRVSSISGYHKALLPINNRPVISHVINQFKNISKVIIAVHEDEELLPNVLKMLYPGDLIEIIRIRKRGDNGGSLGNTLYEMLKHVNGPFYFNPCDSFTSDEIQDCYENVIYASSKNNLINVNQYRSVHRNSLNEIEVHEKNMNDSCEIDHIYTGTMYVHYWNKYIEDFNINFNNAIKCKDNLERGEIYGYDFKNTKFKILKNWHDCGNLIEYQNTIESFQKNIANEFVPRILPKHDEGIFFVDGEVIKFSVDKEFIRKRVERSKILNGWVPEILAYNDFSYKYALVNGRIISDIVDLELLERFLNNMKVFWGADKILREKKYDYTDFYKTKTINRVNLFIKNKEHIPKYINSVNVKDWESLLAKAFDVVLEGEIIGNFHGDLHFENIIYDEKIDRFTLLDWRQEFQGSIQAGDIYYDLSKILHGIIVPHSSVLNELYSITHIDANGESIEIKIERPEIYDDLEEYFMRWCSLNNYNIRKIKLLTAIIFINIAPLHHIPYNRFLFYLGLLQLKQHS